MKLYKVLIFVLFFSFSCDKKQDKIVSNKVVETKNNDLIKHSGDYVFYNNSAVLQTNKNVYGIIINEKVNELNDRLSSIKKDEFDFIPVILKGRLKNKDENDEGWSVKLEITEIVEIINKEE
jgi:uncharacterized protein YktB (UPF0637 family)